MRKLLFISLLLCSLTAFSQGLKLTGKSFINVSDSITLTAIYTYPTLYYNTFDSSISISFPAFYRSVYAAKNVQPLAQSWGIYMQTYIGKSAIGIPTPSYLLTTVTTYLNALGYTVTTF